MKQYPTPPDGLVVEPDGPACCGCASTGPTAQRDHRRHGARAHRDDRGRGQRRARPGHRALRHRRALLLGLRSRSARSSATASREPARRNVRCAWHVNRLIPTMLETQTPIVTAATGYVIGLGLNLVLASDFAVVADDARLRAPFTGMGFTPDSGASWLIPRLVGRGPGQGDADARPRDHRRSQAAEWGLRPPGRAASVGRARSPTSW